VDEMGHVQNLGEGEDRRYTFWTLMEKHQEKMTLAETCE
jgi:hypothetical protein